LNWPDTGKGSAAGIRISSIIAEIKQVLINNGISYDGRKGGRYSNLVYSDMYRWYPGFIEPFESLVTEDKRKIYLQNIPVRGFTIIAAEEATNGDNESILVKAKGKGGIGSHVQPMIIQNKFRERELAVEYLKKQYGPSVAQQAAGTGLNAISDESDRKSITDFAEKHKWDNYELWASVLIYAVSKQLPIDEPSSSDAIPVLAPNVYLASKGQIQDTISLESRCKGARRIVLINYAGTSFLASKKITADAKSDWFRFLNNMMYGGTSVEIVLTQPNSSAAEDAVKYKMRPETLKKSLHNIIQENIDQFKETAELNPDYKMELYLTDIALPCAYFMCEFDDQERDNIKIDMYLPSFGIYEMREGGSQLTDPSQADDNLRQSFMIYRKNNPDLYKVFRKNMEDIINHSEWQSLERKKD